MPIYLPRRCGSMCPPSIDEGHLDAVLCTVDVLKRDAELKLLVGCSLTEKHAARDFHTGEHMSAILVEREAT